jgi:hypothetical protein
MNKKRVSLFVLFSGMLVSVQTAGARPANYLGTKRCKGCHKEQYQSWKDTAMAKSLDSLVPGMKSEAKSEAGLDPNKDYTADPKCLSCHATGYGEPGGFKSYAETPDLGGVACEGCHGPGEQYYSVMSKKRKTYRRIDLLSAGYVVPTGEVCNKCHVPGCPTTDEEYEMDFDDSIGHERFPLKYEH